MTDLAERLTKVERDQSHPNLKPRDAATLILVDRSGTEPKVLLGKRHAGLKFMAGKFVFPGGCMEAGDRKMPVASDLDPQAQSLEGYLFPDTYQFTRTQTLHDIIGLMVKRFRQEAGELGLNTDVHRVVTMASIVEKETAAPDERPMVASVYYNRLDKRMGLDADPSIIYAELLEGTYSGALHHADMQIESPYNTYRHIGLPPGPIGNPGRSALEAAMHPAVSDFYYFVSDGNGHHRFSRSL